MSEGEITEINDALMLARRNSDVIEECWAIIEDLESEVENE